MRNSIGEQTQGERRKYSIAQANSHLSRVIREAELAGAVELTRRGEPVAVVVSMARYRDLSAEPRMDFVEAVARFRKGHAIDENGFDLFAELGDDLRDRSPARDFSW